MSIHGEIEIVLASGQQIDAVQGPWRECWDSLGFPGDFQHFSEEDGEPAGTVALRPLSATSCEAKRLYFRPQCRGKEIGFSEIGPYSSNPTPGAIFLKLSL